MSRYVNKFNVFQITNNFIYIYIYIYIQRETERERERETQRERKREKKKNFKNILVDRDFKINKRRQTVMNTVVQK